MKSNVTNIAVIILFILFIAGAWLAFKWGKAHNDAIEAIQNRKTQTINVDAIKSEIERKILDSLKVSLKEQDAKITASIKVIKSIRRKNEALEKRFDSLIVDMPDF
jgi:hypothetical protein